ncbi:MULTISPECIES: hypothetical protein [unclassified Saccharothrix]|uniref:hypothetical protein n=1 Tax=unclassified Saccharothrix TaxID=2593673 RepID=UPI00307CF768
MDPLVLTYVLYLLLSIGLTIWVGNTLSRNGKVFLVDVFGGNEELARTVNHLLVVGFYLVNFGFVAWYLRTADAVGQTREVFETLSVKVGTVLIVLGILHLGNVFVLGRMRRRSLHQAQDLPPVGPDAYTKLA